ncbi:MAG: SpoIID/LytB domain-containing protein [Clostridiales bacterium]|nr:SpoIID/LytB domain-containing protein [Clostridiales bacterium]MDD6937099.1 SpoIID/LytB domain-containing protein [Clostridiales bacterium]
MKKYLFTVLTLALALALLAGSASAAGNIYVNDSDGVLSGELADAYAIGADESVVQIGSKQTYAMTASGVAPVGDSDSGYDDVPVDLQTVRVGLFYGSSALSEARLENAVGSGYQFGYYDSDRVFHAVGSTAETLIAMVPDLNVSVSAGTIGRYHIRLSQTYASFDAAKSAADAKGGFPAYYNGTYYAMIGSYETQEAAQSALSAGGYGGTVYTGTDRCVTVTKADTTQILFEFDCGSTYSLAVAPVSDSGKAVTWCKGDQYYGDFQYTRLTSGVLTVVNFVGLEDYVKGVVPNEMSASWPLEALKAQAVCARTYVAANQNKYRQYGFDMTNDTYCQVYRGLNGANETTDRAVDETAGLFVRYEGKLCSVAYFAADGGATEDSENVWSDTVIPYLRGVKDPYEADIDFYCKSWSVTVPRSQTGDISVTNTPIGNVMTVTANGQTYSKDNVRTFLKNVGVTYTSRHFTVTYNASDDTYTISGGGYGHNLGMSQWGAYSMAKVHNQSFEDIICFYFTGAYVG